MTESERLAALEREGVRIVRVTYPDLHGVLRGKDVPIGVFASHVIADGLGFCKAISTVDLQHNVVAGLRARLPRHPRVAAPRDARAPAVGARGRVVPGRPDRRRRALRRRPARDAEARDGRASRELGLEPVMGPELEFYLLEPSPASPSGWTRYVENPTHVYTVGDHADPRGILDRMLLALLRRRARRDRRRARVRHEPVGDQPHALERARRGRPRVPLQGRRQGPGHARRHAGDVHGQAVQRRRRLGLPPAPLALRRGRRQRLRRHGRATRAARSCCATSSPA